MSANVIADLIKGLTSFPALNTDSDAFHTQQAPHLPGFIRNLRHKYYVHQECQVDPAFSNSIDTSGLSLFTFHNLFPHKDRSLLNDSFSAPLRSFPSACPTSADW